MKTKSEAKFQTTILEFIVKQKSKKIELTINWKEDKKKKMEGTLRKGILFFFTK